MGKPFRFLLGKAGGVSRGAGLFKAGEWQPETPFPRHRRLHDLSRLRGEIMQSLYHAQQDTRQAETVEFVI